MPDPVTSRNNAATQRATTGPQSKAAAGPSEAAAGLRKVAAAGPRKAAAGPRKAAAGPPLKTKAEKRAEAKATKARARARQKRNQTLSVVGSAVLVVAVLVGLVVWISHGSSHPTAAAAATPSPSASDSAAAFPQLPAGADPALGKKPTVTAGTGTVPKLKTTTLIEGTGPAVTAGQTLSVNYVGVTYADGKEFDSSWSAGKAFSFQVGAGGVIKGWDQGLIGVKVGSRVQLDIPAALAYGAHPAEGQPAGTLRFVVDVLAAS